MSLHIYTVHLECFEVYGKKNYDYVEATVKAVRSKIGNGREEKLHHWESMDKKVGIFPCRSFNLGEQTTSYPHVDQMNLAQSWCSITPLGSFDHKSGGHFVLWDFKMVIEFPAGSTILIPSALLIHSNTPIQPNETRHSIVQYAPGGLFRWKDCGFRTEKDFLASATHDDKQRYLSEQQRRWKEAVGMYTTLDELTIGVGLWGDRMSQ